MSGLVERTIGRRLLYRLWFHGVLLFAGVIALTIAVRHLDADLDGPMAPYVAAAVGDRLADRAAEPAAQAEVDRAAAATGLAISVYRADGALAASTVAPPLAVAGAGDRAWRDDRLVVRTATGVAVVRARQRPSWPVHGVMLFAAALAFALVFVAGPLATALVRPIRQLRAQAAAIGAGELTARSGTTRRDELGDLARSLDAMGAQLARLRAAERQLLGDVSHELRTPLARMRVVLELAERAEPAEVRRYLGEVATDLGELEALVDDIIASARLDAADGSWGEARVPMRTAPVAVGEVLDAAVARFRARWPNRALEVDAPSAAVVVAADAALLRRALDNLLANARAYSDGPITVRVLAAPAGVKIEVVDRGVGIAPEDQPRVFTPLFRADRSRSRASGGVGLGLALARRIVVAHGGAIGFTSEVDRGSTFWLTLPA